MTRETEVKIPIWELGISLDEAHARIEALGFAVLHPRVLEQNFVFDRADGDLRSSRQLLRLRDAGGRATLTYKGVPDAPGPHKCREERETAVGDFAEMRTILERLGYAVTFRYDKHRTEFARPGEIGIVTVDETPAGNYLELEGEPEWIDATSARLGFSPSDYRTESYSQIYQRIRP